MAALTDTAAGAADRIVAELRPPVLDALGLAAAVEWLATEFARHGGVDISCRCDEVEPVAAVVGTALFRAAQEALTNIARHAGARRVGITLKRDGDLVMLTVDDDGCGLAVGADVKPHAFGLKGMRERLLALGGTLIVDLPTAGGTSLRVRCPAAVA